MLGGSGVVSTYLVYNLLVRLIIHSLVRDCDRSGSRCIQDGVVCALPSPLARESLWSIDHGLVSRVVAFEVAVPYFSGFCRARDVIFAHG